MPKRQRDIFFRETGERAYFDNVQFVGSDLRSLGYYAEPMQIGSSAGAFDNTLLVRTDAPLAVVRKIAKKARLTLRNDPRKDMNENPSLVTFANPRQVVSVLSKRAYALQYQHASDRKWYEHKFKRGVCIELLSDGSVRLYRMDGQSLWGDF